MKIKTIRKKLEYAEEFDAGVNAALADGWKLVKREVLRPFSQPGGGALAHMMLYAELEKPDEKPATEAQPSDLLAAARLLRDYCNRVDYCADCPLEALGCHSNPPFDWEFPDDAPEEAGT